MNILGLISQLIGIKTLRLTNTTSGSLIIPNGECLSTQRRTHEKLINPHPQNNIPSSDCAPPNDRSKKSLQAPVRSLATPMDLENYTSPHTFNPIHTDNSQPNTPHYPNTPHTVIPSSEQHASSSNSYATQAIQTILQKEKSSRTDQSTVSLTTTHIAILTPTCRTTYEQLGTTTGRNTPPDQEQSCAIATELSEPLLDTDRGST